MSFFGVAVAEAAVVVDQAAQGELGHEIVGEGGDIVGRLERDVFLGHPYVFARQLGDGEEWSLLRIEYQEAPFSLKSTSIPVNLRALRLSGGLPYARY